MGSDSLMKPNQQLTLIEKFQINRDKAFVHLSRLKPRSLKPWILGSSLVAGILAIAWAIVCNFGAFFVDYLILAPVLFAWDCILPDALKDHLRQFNWAQTGFKVFSRILLVFYACIAVVLWYGSPWGPGGQWPVSLKAAVPYARVDINNYFNDFEGATVCNIKDTDLYTPLAHINEELGYCNSRAALLKAMSEGGRTGFDAPYVPRGCHYRWFSVEEICAILDRFDALVFAGDHNLKMIYAGFNILLRKDLTHGALQPQTDSEKLSSCTCNSQFTDPICHESFIRFSRATGKIDKMYTCERMPHTFLDIDHSPMSPDDLLRFLQLVPLAPPSNYKPIPLVHSVTGDASVELAIDSMIEILNLADASKRNTPMLWIGPTAAGHIEIKGRKGNQEIWRFATDMSRFAQEKDVEALGLWNLTVQANSYDGKGFGEDVSIVTAMMVVNWLARLPSS